jgi:hypothetical protein
MTNKTPNTNAAYETKELILLLSKKWGDETMINNSAVFLEQLRDRSQRIKDALEQAKTTIKEGVEMSKENKKPYVAPWGDSLLAPHKFNTTPEPKKKDPLLAAFPITPDFSEKEFEKFAEGVKFTATFTNNGTVRELISIKIGATVATPGDTIVRYAKKFSIVKETQPCWYKTNELPWQ